MSYFATVEFHEHVIDAAERIKPLPDNVTKLAALVADPHATVNDITAVLMNDVGLTATLLREANSAASSSADPIETLQSAVVRLGSARVVAVAVAATMSDAVALTTDGYGMKELDFWTHARAASIVAESVAALSSVDFSGGLVTAALLQNIGTIVLSEFMSPDVYRPALESTLDQAVAERETIDVDHAAVGAAICRHWRLPEEICEAVEHHHLLDGVASPTAAAVYLTDKLTLELVADVPGRHLLRVDRRCASALSTLGLLGSSVVADAEARLRQRGFDVDPLHVIPR